MSKVFGIIGGSDGPTAVFVAGKVGSGLSPLVIAIIIVIVIGLIIFVKRKKKS